MSAIIEVSSLSKHFKEIKAVDDLSFTVGEGEIYGFLGQNGAGKSTTLRMLLTLIAPSKGQIRFFGKDLHGHRKEILRQVGAVIEHPEVYGYLTAYENLSLFAKMGGHRPPKRDILKQLDRVGLADRAYSKVQTFSQGMKQRLGIAVALVNDPSVIILDEPTNGLDPQGIADTRNLILELGRHQKKTILVSSHQLSEIERIASQILIIDKGRKMVEGNVNELFDPSRMVVEFQALDPLSAMHAIQESRWKDHFSRRQNGHFILNMTRSEIPLFTGEMIQKGVQVVLIQPRHSLEDYFLSLTTPNQHVDAFAN